METNYKIILKEDYERYATTADGSAEIINKYKDPLMEINIYILKKDGNFYLKPPKKEIGMKSYYIEKGMLYGMGVKKYYKAGDLIILNHQDDLLNVVAEEDTYLLVHSLQEDSYESTENSFQFIYDILVQIQRKDAYTHDHSLRVYDLARKTAERLNYSGTALQNFLWAAKYHDIGKIFIPDEILNKPGALTDDEFEVMREHTIKGKDLILEYFNPEIYEIILQHHERLDGSGYPKGLKEEEIREEARILAICDSFDAMTTNRIYRKGKSTKEALQELLSLGGKKYDENLLNLFMEVSLEEERK